MPTISINKKKLLKEIGFIDDKFLAKKISMLGTDLEEINNEEIIVEIFPNRPDLLSQQGFTRALKSFLGLEKGLKKYKVEEPKIDVYVDESVKECRPYTVCAVIRNLDLTDDNIKEIIQLQEKIHVTFGRKRKKMAIGIYPLEKIKPPIYFKGLKPEEIYFRPLESDKEMSGLDILRNHPKGREYAHLLEGLNKYACFLDSNNNFLSMTPIINSDLTGKVTTDTKDVFIECSGFDLKVLNKALNMIVSALGDMNGIIEGVRVHYPNKTIITPNLEPEKIKVDINYINKILGLNINKNEFAELISMMGFDFDEKNNILFIPPWRADILHQIDICEDVAIAYGYDNFKSELPCVCTEGKESEDYKISNKIIDSLIGLGFFETINYSLVSKDLQNILGYKNIIKLANSISKGYDSLRKNPLPSLLQVLVNNRNREYPQRFFEVGYGFSEKDNDKEEELFLAGVLAGEKEDFTTAKQVIKVLENDFNKKFYFEKSEEKIGFKGRIAIIKYNDEEVGLVGELNPEIIEYLNLEVPVSFFIIKTKILNKN